MSQIEVKIPDIGDYRDVPVIEILVKVGDAVEAEQSLVTLESDKATMDIPSPVSGVVSALKVKVGDTVSEGSLVLLLDEKADAKPVAGRASDAQQTASAAPVPTSIDPVSTQAGSASNAPHADIECELLVLGAGPGGYSAAFRAADLGRQVVLVERYAQLGGVCLNVGCIPSKALLHTAAVMEEARAMQVRGIRFDEPNIDLEKLRTYKREVVGKLTTGLAGMAKARQVSVVQGIGKFVGPHHLEVTETAGPGRQPNGASKVIRFEQAIIAAGSQSVKLPHAPDDPRILDSTSALALATIPGRMLVIGGGIIGLEMATVYAALGTRIDVVEMLDTLMQGADRDLVGVWQKFNAHTFDKIMLKTRATTLDAKADGIHVAFEGANAPSEAQCYDVVLVAVGRSPNGKPINAATAGVAVSDRGFIAVDQQQRTNVPHIFAIGDVVGQPMLAHKAVHEGHVAAEVASGMKSYFDAVQIPSVAYTDPEVAWAGKTEEQCKVDGIAFGKAVFPWAASGRAIANGRSEGFTKLLFDHRSHRVIGGGVVGAHAGDLISEICLAIEMGADATDIGKTIHPHPTLSESIGMTAEVFEGVCTDLPPPRKRK